jgi:hypothetical protein
MCTRYSGHWKKPLVFTDETIGGAFCVTKGAKVQLRPLTIVSEKILLQWKKDGYNAKNEYWVDSPKGLTYSEIIK